MGREKITELERMIEVVVRSIPKEREARDLYRSTADSATMEMTRALFDRLARDEQMHEEKLVAVLELLQKEMSRRSGG